MSEENEQGTGREDYHSTRAVFQEGDIFGQYKVIGLLGAGGMGQVYEVHHRTLGTRHALKLINPELLAFGDDTLLKFFRKEARVMAQLKHVGIVHVDDYGEEEGMVWLRQELVEGVQTKEGNWLVTLEEYIHHKGGRLPEAEVRECMRQFLDALGFAHSKGCVHRDLKPGNILIDNNGMRITDFGLVQLMQDFTQTVGFQSLLTNNPDPSSRTESENALMGTYEYMSPEQKRGKSDERSDLFSVGLICFRMLTGQKVLGVTRPSALVEGINPDWDSWLLKTMAEDPDDRFQTALEMSEALPSLGSSTEIQEKPAKEPTPAETEYREEPVEPSPEPSGSRKWGVLFVIFVLLVIAGGYVYWKNYWNVGLGWGQEPGPKEEGGKKQVVDPGEPGKGELTAVSVEPPPNVSIPPPTFIPPPANPGLTPPQLNNNTLQENQPAGTLVGTLFIDGNVDRDSLGFELVGGDKTFFQVNGDRLESATAFNHESRPKLKAQVRVTAGENSNVATLDVVVTDVNEPPAGFILGSNTILENQSSGTEVGTLFARDPEGDRISFSLPNARDSALFKVEGRLLETRVALDFENPKTRDLKITIRVKDSKGLGVDVVQSIQVKNVNEPPTGISIDKAIVPENLPPSTLVGTFIPIDPDAGDRHTFQIVENAAGRYPFRIQSNQLMTLQKLDYEEKKSYLLPVRVTDRSGESKVDVLAIQVMNFIESIPESGEILDYFFYKDQLWNKVRVIRNTKPYITLKLPDGEVVSRNYEQFQKHARETNDVLRKGTAPTIAPPIIPPPK